MKQKTLVAKALIVTLAVMGVFFIFPDAFAHAQGGNPFSSAEGSILNLARNAWSFLITLTIAVAMLGGLYYVLQGTAGAAFGGSRMAAMAIIGGIGIIIAVLVTFFVLPELGQLLQNSKPEPPF